MAPALKPLPFPAPWTIDDAASCANAIEIVDGDGARQMSVMNDEGDDLTPAQAALATILTAVPDLIAAASRTIKMGGDRSGALTRALKKAGLLFVLMLLSAGCNDFVGVTTCRNFGVKTDKALDYIYLATTSDERASGSFVPHLRVWAEALPDRCDRAAYIYWVDYYERKLERERDKTALPPMPPMPLH